MDVEVTIDGETLTHTLSGGMDGLSLKQAVKLEKVMGADRVQRLLGGDVKLAQLPTTLQAMIYVQLSTVYPTLKLDDFDFDLMSLAADDEPVSAGAVVVPMTLPDGTEVEGASTYVDPPRQATTG